MTQPPLPIMWVMACLTAIAAASDVRSRIIPNWLVAAGMLLGFGLNSWLLGWAGLAEALMGFALALAVYMPLFFLRAMGAGDLKLMAAVGALAGPKDWLAIFALTSVLGGLFALAVLLLHNSAGRTLRNICHIGTRLARLRLPYADRPELDVKDPRAVMMPHGVAIAAGTLAFFLIPR